MWLNSLFENEQVFVECLNQTLVHVRMNCHSASEGHINFREMMLKRKFSFFAVIFVLLWLLIWPTIEHQSRYDDVVIDTETHRLTIQVVESYKSNDSRFLHKVSRGSPYWFGLSFSNFNTPYDYLEIESVKFIEENSRKEFLISRFKGFKMELAVKNTEDIYLVPKVTKPSDKNGYLLLDSKAYTVEIDYVLCENEECKEYKFTRALSLIEDLKLYSETFAQMMGI